MSEPTPGPEPIVGLLAELRDRASPADVGLLLAAPVVLIVAFSFPAPVRESLAFSHADPSIVTAFAAHYVHLDATHLRGNLAVYAMVVPPTYLLFLLSGRRREFAVIVPAILLAFPFVLSASSLVLVRRGVLLGFSGLAMAFVGVLPVAAFRYVGERVPRAIDVDDAPVLFFTGSALIALRSGPSTLGPAIATLAGIVALAYAVRLGRALGRPGREEIGRALRRTGHVELWTASPVLFFLSIVVAFPADPVAGGAIVDLYGHFLGYGLGFIATYVTLRLDDATPDGAGGTGPASSGRR